ncbi:hypothetical protein [Runella sp.]|uniref:hypothetical protein n=1 Tax=Runella sp. TaxID=1960881 RepID=UPI00301B0E5D
MARIYYGSFKSINNITHRVEIWNAPTGTANSGGTELTLAGDGYTITRKGEGDSLYTNYIRPSRVETYWVIPNNTVLTDFMSIATTSEQYWAILIYKDGVLDYVGRVLADQLTRKREAIQAKPILSLTAVDGLELLSGYKVDASNFTDGKIQISQLFRRALDTLNLKEYWVVNGTQTDYFREASTVYNSGATRKGFDLEEVDINTFVSDYDQFKDVRATDVNQFIYADNSMIDYAQALEQLCEIKQARLIHSQGKYWLVSFADYIDSTITYRVYSYTLQYQNSTATYSHRQTLGTLPARPQWMAKPDLTHQVAAKFVQVDTERRLGDGVYRSWNNKTSTSLTKIFTDIPTGSNPDEKPMRVRFNVKFAKDYKTVSGVTYAEQYSIVTVQIHLEDSSGNKQFLNQNNYYWYSGAGYPFIPKFREKFDTQNQSSTWSTFVFDKNLTTAPAGFTNLHVLITVESVFTNFDKKGKPTGHLSSPVSKDFWGSINVAFADASPYENPDFTFNITEVYSPSAGSSVNSVPVILNPKYYSSNTKYATGIVRVFDGTNYITSAANWYGGWDSVTKGTISEMLGNSVAGLYKDFMPVIQGTWVDSGTLTAIKSLYFDGYTWVLQGCQYSAGLDQWSGEWIAIIPTYSGLTSSGEGLRLGGGVKDRVNYLDMQVSNINQQLGNITDAVKQVLSNEVSGSPATVPTSNTQYEVMLAYNLADDVIDWKLQEHGTFKTYTAGTYTLDEAFEGHIGNTAGGSVILNLPAVATQKGKKYYFVKSGSSHTFRINAATGENINGSDHFLLNTNYDSHTIICDGTQWFIIAAHP